MSACSVSGTSRSSSAPTRRGFPVALERAAVEEHAHRLDRVERDAVGASRIFVRRRRAGRGRGRRAARPSRRRTAARARARGAAAARTEVGAALEQLGAGQREHEDRLCARPLEQVLDEVEQAVSAQWRSSKTSATGAVSLIRSKKRRHAAKRSSRSDLRPFAEAQQVAEQRLHPLALAVIGDDRSHHPSSFAVARVLRLVLGDPRAHAHHLGQCPERDSLAVGRAPALMPVDVSATPSSTSGAPRRAATCRSRPSRRP